MTTKEKVLKLRNLGKTYKQISEELGICKSLISYHIGVKIGRKPKKNCKKCGIPIINSKTFCSKECCALYKFENIKLLYNEGGLLTNNTIRKVLIEEHGNICFICGINSNWNNKPLTLQVDHIDGNSDNNFPNNLRLVCPNCHSQLETSKSNKFKKQTKRNTYLRKFKGYE